MPTWVWIVIAAAAAVLVLLIVFVAIRQSRRKKLQSRFGSEYDRTVEQADSRRDAEAELRERERRHEEFELRDLDRGAAARYREDWQHAQAVFVDDPPGAITEADRLIKRVMEDRGYPVANFEQRAADLSVEHADVIDNYRDAHAIALSSESGNATTEDLRRAMKRYRTLFDELVDSTCGAEVTR